VVGAAVEVEDLNQRLRHCCEGLGASSRSTGIYIHISITLVSVDVIRFVA
jgi:hypothetical protein